MEMSPCAIQQKKFATPEDAWTSVAKSVEKKGPLVCPKPRHLSLIQAMADPSSARPFRLFVSQHLEDGDVKAGNELMDIILSKDVSSGTDNFFEEIASSSPPFFSGSPPSRVSNPLIQDARFRDEKFTPVSPRALPTPSPLSLARARANFVNSPAMRIEGFDCTSSVPALA